MTGSAHHRCAGTRNVGYMFGGGSFVVVSEGKSTKNMRLLIMQRGHLNDHIFSKFDKPPLFLLFSTHKCLLSKQGLDLLLNNITLKEYCNEVKKVL